MTKPQAQAVRDRIAAEAEALQASMRERQASPMHATDFAATRDRRRVAQLRREVSYLNAVLVAEEYATGKAWNYTRKQGVEHTALVCF